MMKKTILALTIPALFATSASAVEIYAAEDGSKVDLYGRLQYEAGAFDYQQATVNGTPQFANGKAIKSGKAQNFGGQGEVRLGVNVKYVLDDATALIGKYEAQLAAESSQNDDIKTRYAWVGFRFMDTTDLTFGKSEAPRALLTDLTDTFDIFGAVVTDAGGFNRVDDQVRLSYAENGVDLRAAYAFNDARKQDDNVFNGDDRNGNRWGASAGYTAPIGLGVIANYNEESNDGVVLGLKDKTSEWGVGTHYSIDGFYFAGLYGERDMTYVGASDGGNKFWELQAAYTVDQWTLIADYANQKGRKADSDKFKVDQYTFGVRYAFTPKTKVYGEYVLNEVSGKDDLYGVGLQYNF